MGISKLKEFCGTKDCMPEWGRDYYVKSEDRIIVDRYSNPYSSEQRYENKIANCIDDFFDGRNSLMEIDGILYEVYAPENGSFRIRRRAYATEEEAMNSGER